jgi:hypothetical protein
MPIAGKTSADIRTGTEAARKVTEYYLKIDEQAEIWYALYQTDYIRKCCPCGAEEGIRCEA